jgi:phosphatidylinositol alpha-1,6-mannosyltransferase
MERLNARMADELAIAYDVTVLAPKGSRSLGGTVHLRTSPWGGLVGFLAWATFVAIFDAMRRRPAWVVGGSGLVAPVVWLAARASRARMGLYVHGLDIVVANSLYRLVWLPFIRRADRIVANSRNTADLALRAGVGERHVVVVNPGTDLSKNHATPAIIEAFRAAHGLVGARILLSVGRLTVRKGLAAFIESVLPAVVNAFPDAVLVVIGDDAQDALSGGGTSQRAQAQAAARRHGLDAHVRFLGPVSEEELLAAYASSDVHIFPVHDVPGDVEGFGMVAIEAAAHGLPTVAYAAGGVPDAVEEGTSGHLVTGGDGAAFAAATCAVLSAGRASFDTSARAFAARFAWPLFGKGVRAAWEDRS